MIDSKENIETQSVTNFTEQAYLDYAMSVILDRALPHIGDGLKPVQRRIVYAMSELGLSATAKYKKSARTVGDVLGKFHPHSDSACYEAMVLMAQKFSYRYPLIDGQGNWGSSDDPKSFAAMRYTESRLSPYANALLSEVGHGTVDWINNFDGTLQEPKVLPARLPNILLNGTTGIAVGMATDIPPHNLTEVIDACILLLDNPKATLKQVMACIQGPDFPTEAEIITPKTDLHKTYQTGQGTIRMRGVYIKEGNDIVVTALPHLVSGSKVLEQIASQMQSKKLQLVADLRDESDHENPTRLIIVPRSNRVDVDELMDHLFATTELERSYRVNLNVIGLDNKPKVMGLVKILQNWLEFRQTTVKNRLEYRLQKVIERLHILDGYLIAFLNIEQVINIIRKKDDPKKALITKYQISEQQADAILNLKLRHLAKLEEMKIKGEQQNLSKERAEIESTLNSDKKLKTLIKKELKQVAKDFGGARLSPLVERAEAKALAKTTKVVSEPMTVILSSKGWVRAGKGHEVDIANLSYKSGDEYRNHVLTKSDSSVVFMDSFGRAYTAVVSSLPSMRGYGDPLTSRFSPEAGAVFTALLSGQNSDNFALISSAGYGFFTNFGNLLGKNRKGKGVINVPKGFSLLPPILLPKAKAVDNSNLILATTAGQLLVFNLSELPELNKGKGRKLITMAKGAELQFAFCAPKDATVTICAGTRKKLKLTAGDLKVYHGEISSRGPKLPKAYLVIKDIVVD